MDSSLENVTSFSYRLQEHACKIFSHTLRPPASTNELTLRVLSRRVVNCLDIADFTPYVVFEYLQGGVWDDSSAPNCDADKAARICEFFAGIRPDLASSRRVPHSVEGYASILAGIYDDFSRTWPVFAPLASQHKEVLRGFRIISQTYLRPPNKYISLV